MITPILKVHYICPGECRKVSDAPGNCGAEKCSFYGQPLHECHCKDGLHRQNIPANPAAVPA